MVYKNIYVYLIQEIIKLGFIFFLAEISVRPEDVNLRIKQIKLFESSGRLSEAYSYAINIEKTSKFQKDNVEWYEVISVICEVSNIFKISKFIYIKL